MRNVSQQFKDKLLNGDYNYLATAEVTLEDNTTLTLTNTELWTGGFSIDDAVSEDNSFTALGSTIINASKIIINNIDETYSIYDFHNATVILKVAKNLIIDDRSVTESIRLGTFRVDDVSYNGTTITLALLDYMEQFDRPYNLSNLAYPATLDQIVRDACNCCGVYLNTYDFPHKNYTVSSKPDSDSVTFREVIGWAAAIAGCFARCNVYGQLELKWFDIDNLINQASGTYHDISSIFSQEISLDDTVITGVIITVSGERNEETQYSSGTEGYTINIKGNEFITANQAQTVANWLGQAVIGMQFRKLNITHLNDPSIEAGDIAVVTDRKGNTYPTLVTRTNFSVGNTQTTVCGSETPSRNSATRYSSATKSFVKARKMLRQESTARELQYEQLNERLDEHTGLYSTQEVTQSGTIYYFHDMPDLQDSTVIWKMTSEAWGVSTDGGQTWNAGMTVDGDTLVRILSATGINADWINAGTLEIKDTNGNVIFQASKDSHSVFISGNVQMTGSQTLSGAISSAENNANSYTDNAVSDYAETVTAKFTEIEGRIDGQVETWFYDYAPTLNNVPASNWTTEETRDVHKGDLFIDTSSGNSYRFLKENGTWMWKLISDSTATAALQAAARAQDTADHKRRVFYTTPTPPYDQGDLWVQGETGDILRCAQQRAEGGSYVATDWVKASKYTDDSAFETFINNDYNATIANLWEQLDGKSETFYQDTDPSLQWTTVGVPWLDHTGDAFLDHEENEIYLAYAEMANAHEGDLWHNTTDNTEWIWQNGEWKPMSIPDEVFDTLDGKAQIFGVQPYTPYHVSDLWFTGDEILYCQTERLTGDFNAADWTKKEGYTDDSSLITFVNTTYIPQMELFSNQLDEKIETWYQDTDPSTEWNQIEEDYWLDSEGEAILDQDGNEFTLLYTPTQLLHNGDFWHNTSDNTEYIYKDGEWQQLDVPDEFFDLVDGKAVIFTSEPTVPYNENDLWFTGEAILVSTQTRTTGTFVASDWIKKDYYTDDSALLNWISTDFANTIQELQEQTDQKAETWYQSTDPSTQWTTAELKQLHTGDLWYNTADGANTTWFWDGTRWVQQNIPAAVFDEIDGKAQIFVNQPTTPYSIGDLWFDSATSDIMTCIVSRTSGNYNANDWQKRNKYTDDTELNNFVNTTYQNQVENFQNQIDNKVETFYQSNDPQEQWATTEPDVWVDSTGDNILDHNGQTITLLFTSEHAKHEGDLWHNTSDNTEWMYKQGVWQPMEISDELFDMIDGRATVFTSTPVVPYNKDDMWFTGSEILVSNTTRKTGSFNRADWTKKDFYTDDSALTRWISGEFADTVSELQDQADQKAETWYQTTDPSGNWTTADLKAIHKGDLWYNTSNQTTWFWNGASWQQQNVPIEVFDEIDGKAQIFVNRPTTPYRIGDLWFNSATSDIMTCVTQRLTGNYNADDWQKRNKYTDDSSFINWKNTTYADTIQELQEQTDQKAETWYQATNPANVWTTPELKALHKGDLWYCTTNIGATVYKKGTTWFWDGTEWKQQNVPEAVFDEIDTKAQIFVTQPTHPYYKNDLWFDGSVINVCITNSSGSFNRSHWARKEGYTDDSTFNTWKANDYKDTIEDFQTQIDGKIETWNQETDPATSWTSSAVKTKHTGDIWYHPVDKVTKRYSGSVWVTLEDAEAIAAQNLASVKRRIFTTTPVPPYDKGDLWWTSTTDGSAEIKMSKNTRTSGVYVADDWILSRYVDGDDVQTAITTYDSSLGQTEVFNKLTNGGDVQGIYIQDGKVYINATYIMSGTLAGERINGRNIHVIDNNNNSTFYIDDAGNVQINASALSIVGKNIRDYVSSSVNLLEDPYGLSNTYWTAVGTVTREQRDPMGGTNAIKLTAGTSDSRFFTNQNTNKPLKSKNTTYRFSVWLKASRTIENFQLSINYTNHVEKITVTTEWKLYTINYEVGDTISSASHVIIGGGNSFSSGDIYIYYPSVQYTDLYMSQALIMDRLTNGGTEQGLYLSDNKVYINGEYIKAKSISANEIKDSTITGGKIANATIANANILAGTITGAKLANSTITGAKIADGTIEAANIKDGTITGTKIANATITGTQIQASTITGAKIASTTIEASNIKDGTITGAKIANATISGSNIQSATITGAKIASTTIEASNIKDGTITGTKIANATIAGSNIQSATITGSKISTGTIENTNIKDGTITGAKIASATITGAKIAGSTITAAEILDGTITNAKISDATITGAKIASSTITGAKIANSTITGGKINISDLKALNATIGGFKINTSSIEANDYADRSALKIARYSNGGYIRTYDTGGNFYVSMYGATFVSSVNQLCMRLIADCDVNSYLSSGDENNLGKTTFYGKLTTASGVDFKCKGSKDAVRDTKHYGEQSFHCYETTCEMFGDIGDGKLDETGTCIVDIDDIMTEACNTNIQYYVFLQKCGEGDCWVDDRQPRYFIVKGTPGLTFSWELKAKQTGYEHIRYNDAREEIREANFTMPRYEQQFANELDSIIERLED